MAKVLTSTSYAILGHLALQPWTMYALAEQFRKNVRYYFPRAESHLYAEPKRLVKLGLAKAQREKTGKRSRTVYSITPKGLETLTKWLGAAPTTPGPVLEFEAVLRTMLAPFGTDKDLIPVLQGVREEMQTMLDIADQIRDEYAAGSAPFQRFVVHRSIMHDFLCSFAELVDDWATRSIKRVERWPRMSQAAREEEALAVYQRLPKKRLRRKK